MIDRDVLFSYRLMQAEETLQDAERMLVGNFTPRSITNRAYYSLFYAVLALFLKTSVDIKTSKHGGVIAIFDKEFIRTGKIDKHFSVIIHKLFNLRQKGDYKELVVLSIEESEEYVKLAEEFLTGIKDFITRSAV